MCFFEQLIRIIVYRMNMLLQIKGSQESVSDKISFVKEIGLSFIPVNH